MSEKNIPQEQNPMVGQIELTDEDGNKELFQELQKVEYQGRQYAVLCPANIGDEKEVGLVIMEYVDDGASLRMLDDEQLCEEVFNAFVATLDDEEA